MSYDELKLIVMQDDAEKNQVRGGQSTSGGQSQVRTVNVAYRGDRCYSCQAQDHHADECPNKGKGIKCYFCNKFGNHNSFD